MRPLPILLLAGLAAGTTVFAGPDLSKLPPASPKTGLTYATDIRPIFEASCFRCHGEQRQKGKIRLDSLDAVLKGGEDGKIVIPGDGTKSPIVIAVSRLDPDSAMPPMHKKKPGEGNAPQGGGPPGAPPPPKPLTPEQVGLVRAWIDQGAK
ncbi:MAG: c-type cytochrome domain-containing protein [Chthoniobacterales bacterium]